jgi:hypothetical protein
MKNRLITVWRWWPSGDLNVLVGEEKVVKGKGEGLAKKTCTSESYLGSSHLLIFNGLSY